MSRGPTDWRLEPHCCRACFGRIASRPDGDRRLYHCTNCGAEAHGERADVLCACGTKMRVGKHGSTYRDAGLRCHENRARSPEFPSLYTASYGGAQADT